MHFSKHQMQHWTPLRTSARTLFFCPLACSSKYFITYLMNSTRATMKEPNITEPRWYLNVCLRALGKSKDLPLASEGWKNQMDTVMATINWPKATLKALFHRKTKK